jgi:signal transduction histidine kinase
VVRLVNHSYAQIWQGTPATSLNRSLYSVAPCMSGHAQAHQRALSGETQSVRDCRIMDPLTGRVYYYDIHYIPVVNEYGNVEGLISTAVDVTEQHELGKLKDELLMYAAHELKTPLTSLKGFAKVALRAAETSGDTRIQEYLGAISRQIDKINRLASSLLDVSRIEHDIVTLEADRFDFVEFVRGVTRHYELTRPDYTFSLTLPASPAWVSADRQLIEQVLTNLLDNGIKYSPDDKRIDISLEADGDMLVTSVRDYGIGIPPDQRDKVFDRFFRAANASGTTRNGLGVGLYIARDIISRHEGHIWLERTCPPGCDFRFSLPVEMRSEK